MRTVAVVGIGCGSIGVSVLEEYLENGGIIQFVVFIFFIGYLDCVRNCDNGRSLGLSSISLSCNPDADVGLESNLGINI